LRILQVEADPLPELSFTATWVQGPDSHAVRIIAQMAQKVAGQADGGTSL
jgi:hypothetical protein